MQNAAITQPNARTFPLVDIVNEVLRGRVRVPEFQRPLRWQWLDVQRLFDSIIKGFPIGNLLLWQRRCPAARVNLGELTIEAPELTDGLWVVDGQQRLVSLANALTDEGYRSPRFELAYDFRTEKGGLCRPPKSHDDFIIPLPVLYDLERLLQWAGDEHKGSGVKITQASKITKRIREYQIPAYVVEQEDEEVLRDIFDRMNNYGKRLSRAEVFAALHPSRSSAPSQRNRFEDIITRLDGATGFGALRDDTLLQAVLARRGPDVARDIRVEFSTTTREPRDFADESEEDAYQKGEAAVLRAIRFLQEEAGVPHLSLLPYAYLLVVLARFFAHFPDPGPRNRTLLRRFFWRAVMLGPNALRGSWTGTMRGLTSRIHAEDEDGSIQRLLETPMDRGFELPAIDRFISTAADSRVVLNALWSLGPRSLLSVEPFELRNLSVAIEDRGSLARIVGWFVRHAPAGYQAWAANRYFMLDDDPVDFESIQLALSRLGERDRQAILSSHALTEELVDLLVQRDGVAFLKGRQELLRQVVEGFVERMTERGFEDTPPLETFDLDDDGGTDG